MKTAPVHRFFIGVALSLVLAGIALGIAVEQRWLGLGLIVKTAGSSNAVVVDHVAPEGPAAGRISPGSELVALRWMDLDRVEIEPLDLIPEPDVLNSHDAMRRFFEKQGQLAMAVAGPYVGVELLTPGGEATSVRIDPKRQRPIADLPADFWIQMGVGLTGFWVGLWIWTLRPNDWATRCLALTGAALMTSAFTAATYSTRELGMNGTLFAAISATNAVGSLSFGVGMIGLFLFYPRTLASPRWIVVPAIVLGAWLLADLTGVTGSPAVGRHLAILTAMITILLLVLVQAWMSRRSPVDRSALAWLGLAVIIGAGAFVATATIPALLGVEAIIAQAEAFLFFLLIYLGVALGVARFRLFELGEWAFRILFYLVGVLLLIVLDALLIITVVDERAPAFALSLVIVSTLWLPLRDVLGSYLTRRRTPQLRNLFHQVMDVALTPPDKDPVTRWQALLRTTYAPLNVRAAENVDRPTVVENGAALLLPASRQIPALRLEYPNEGRRLFTPRDLELADELIAMLSNAEDSLASYERGVAQERERIARDIHDNIGVQLLGALHSSSVERKDMMVRETLTDLRDIINNASHSALSFNEMLPDLRAQMSEYLEAADVTLIWNTSVPEVLALPLPVLHTVRSIIREAVQNILKHSSASQVEIDIRAGNENIEIAIRDNGQGFDVNCRSGGHGLDNMRLRVEAQGGSFKLESGPDGTRIQATLAIPGQVEAVR